MKLDVSYNIQTYGWFDSLYDTFFNSDGTDPSYFALSSYDLGTLASRSFISRSGWFGFNNCDDTEATYPWEMMQEDMEDASDGDMTASNSTMLIL